MPTIVYPPTERQLEILEFMRASYRGIGVPPTIREIGAHLGSLSTNGVICHLKAMAKKGMIRHVRAGGSRCWVPAVPEGHCPCCGRESE